jgi:hypothetical protein
MRVYEVARELDITPTLALKKLQEAGIHKVSASSTLSVGEVDSLRTALGTVRQKMLEGMGTPRQSGWSANPVRPSSHPDTKINLERLQRAFPVASDHIESLAQLGSQYVYVMRCKERGFDDCYVDWAPVSSPASMR